MEIGAVFWIVLLVVFIAVEAATMGLTTIWFAGGAVAGFIASILGGNVVVQIILFFVVSILLLIFTRPFAAKYINKDKVRTNVDGLIGEKAIVTQPIDNLAATGEVQLDGKVWTARAEEENIKIPAGETVSVVKISGVKLIVKPQN